MSVKKCTPPCQHGAAARLLPRFYSIRRYYDSSGDNTVRNTKPANMLRSKKDVDRHVRDLLKKTKTENDVSLKFTRWLRGTKHFSVFSTLCSLVLLLPGTIGDLGVVVVL